MSCLHPGCNTLPIFSIKETREAMVCSSHREEFYAIFVRKKCFEPLCNNFPIFGLTKPVACHLHKELTYIDLAGRKCVYPTCNNLSAFGIEERLDVPVCFSHINVYLSKL